MRVLLDKVSLSAGGDESPSGLTIVETRAVQAVDYVRADYGAQFGRANFRHEIAFRVTRLHTSLQASLEFILDHPQTIPETGMLSFLFNDRGSSGVGRWIRDAVLIRVECVALVGLTSIWAYQLVGGQVLKKNPNLFPSAGALP